jgi:hypothetical protein
MDEERKQRIRNAIEKFHARQLPEEQFQPKRVNQKPEAEVQKAVHSWLEENGCFAFRVESKAMFDVEAEVKVYSQTEPGVADELAVHCSGLFVSVECKAPGKRNASNLRYAQREFALKVIAQNGFACVTDSVSHLSSLWASYWNTPAALRKALLLKDLPPEPIDHGFNAEMGF